MSRILEVLAVLTVTAVAVALLLIGKSGTDATNDYGCGRAGSAYAATEGV